MSDIKLAILGFNTDIGKGLFDILENENIVLENIFPLSYTCQEYDAATFLGKNYLIQDPNDFDFEQANLFIIIGHEGNAPALISRAKNAGALPSWPIIINKFACSKSKSLGSWIK